MPLNDPARVRGLRRLIDLHFDQRDLRDPTLRLWVPAGDGYRSTVLRPRTVHVLGEVTDAIEPSQIVEQTSMLQHSSLSPDEFLGGVAYLHRLGILKVRKIREDVYLDPTPWIGFGPLYLKAHIEGLSHAPRQITHYARRNRSRSP